LLEQKQVTFGIILPYIWVFVFICLIMISFVSIKISYVIAAENLILLTFILAPIIFTAGIIISLVTMLKSGLSKSVLFAISFNIVLLIVWFLIRNSFYIEFNMIG
jgi:hypothetical protein